MKSGQPLFPSRGERAKSTLLLVLFLLALVASSLILAGCGGNPSPDGNRNTSNTDPKQGWVRVGDSNSSLFKRCDGTTMVYEDNSGRDPSLTSVSNAKQCGGEVPTG